MTQYISHWNPDVGLWLEVQNTNYMEVIIIIAIILMITIIIAKYHDRIGV